MIDLENYSSLKLGDSSRHLHARKKMIRLQIQARGVKDLLVLQAIEAVPRHRFVRENMEKAAYDDTPLPIGENQTISQPYIVAYMTEALGLMGHERVLEVGAGSGYQAAVLAEIVAQVYTVEINENLAIEAALRLKKMGCTNVRLRFGDGYKGWSDEAPFDGIVVTAAPNHIPQTLVDQLKVGGKMVIPVGESEQELVLVTRLADGSYRKDARIPVRFVPMIRQREQNN
ncbi:MAG: protein-L-isoaspartate(D-aspartate) O-methyltransferase [bacterium]